MSTHSSTLAWKIPWMEERGRLQSMGSQRVGHDWATSLSLWCGAVVKNLSAGGDAREAVLIPGSRRSPGGENGNTLQYSCLENPMDRGAWRATVPEVRKSWTQLRGYSRRNLYANSWVFYSPVECSPAPALHLQSGCPNLSSISFFFPGPKPTSLWAQLKPTARDPHYSKPLGFT